MTGRVLGIDYGSVRIGIALSDDSNKIAIGKELIPNDSHLLQKLFEFIKQNNVGTIVLGYPLTLKGTKSAFTLKTEKFETELHSYLSEKNFNIPIIRWDERLTSKMAEKSIIDSGMKKKKKKDKGSLDIISAVLILQSYLDSNAFNRTL
jgi:putative Holliday junction resolvase